MTQPGEPPQNGEEDNVDSNEEIVCYYNLGMEEAKILYQAGIFNASALVYIYVVLNQTEEGLPSIPETPNKLGISNQEFILAIEKVFRFVLTIPQIQNSKS
ncbi:MAG: hypothetical protein J7647_09295 [Cyanobacteria bacterium SBLK]|nr:hypothetical protein [Cyanobacteria bacterium SBLK]